MRALRVPLRLLFLLLLLLLARSRAADAQPITSSGPCPTAPTFALNPGAQCFRTDTLASFQWTGSAWQQIGAIAGGGVSVGPGGTALTNGIVIYTPSLTPAATPAAIGTTEQTFTVTGLNTSDTVNISGPTPTSLCPVTNARVSAANTLALAFTTLTAAACTPAAGTYRIEAIR